MATITPNMEYASLTGISSAIAGRRISAAEVTDHLLARIEAVGDRTRAFAHVNADGARAQARAADAEIARGFHRGPLHGVPIALKDLIHTTDQPTECGMRIHNGWMAPEDSTIVTRLRHAGAVLIGKTELTDAATQFHHPDRPPPLNPHDPERCVGFSSSGSGAAVAAGLCPAALGSDTGGSIRIPSAMNGVTGLKPTWGRVTRHGTFDLAPCFDTIGPMARSAADVAAVLGVMAGADPRDPTAAPVPVPDYLAEIGGGFGGLRIGIDMAEIEAHCDADVSAVARSTMALLASHGASVQGVSLPDMESGAVAALIGPAAADVHRDSYAERATDYGPGPSWLIDYGASIPARNMAAALGAAYRLRGRLAAMFTEVDLLLVPALARATPLARDIALDSDPQTTGELLRYCGGFSITGHPTLTLPCGIDGNGMPVGMQLVARPFEEALALRAGHAWQSATDWHTRHPAF